MNVVCSTENPHDVLDYLHSNDRIAGLYFLDLDLGCDIDGTNLALEIRKCDPRSFIVFITSDGESQTLMFKYRIEAMDYMVKSTIDLEKRICDCIDSAYQRFMVEPTPLRDVFTFKLYQGADGYKSNYAVVDCADIVYLETSVDVKRVIRLYTIDSCFELNGSLSKIEEKLDRKVFLRCSRSVIININNVSGFDFDKEELTFKNGLSIWLPVKQMRRVKNKMQA